MSVGPARLHRRGPGVYGLDLNGEPHLVIRTTDGTLSSAVIWEVRRERDRAEVDHFTTLADVRAWATKLERNTP